MDLATEPFITLNPIIGSQIVTVVGPGGGSQVIPLNKGGGGTHAGG